jgi:hypothetical protein
MSRSELIDAILSVECDFPVDLTKESLGEMTRERLRHIYAALKLRERDAKARDEA